MSSNEDDDTEYRTRQLLLYNVNQMWKLIAASLIIPYRRLDEEVYQSNIDLLLIHEQ